MALILVPPRGKQTQPEQYLLGNDEVSIGRVDGNSITLKDDSVSRHHARIYQVEDRLLVEDVGSTNGTFLNRQRLTPHLPHALREGDTLHLGRLQLSVNFD